MSKPKIDISKCLGCDDCLDICPVDAIRISKKTGKPYINQKRCVECGACVDICPIGAIKKGGNNAKKYRRY